MKSLKDFENEKIDFNLSNIHAGVGETTGCAVYDECTYSTCGNGTDETITYYDDNGNETGWCITDPCLDEDPCK